MRFNKLDLNLLVVLDALIIECSITRASERLYLSTSATSNALSRLRDYFNDELLVQVGRKMELTPKAESLRLPVRDILMRVETTVATDLKFNPAESNREFRIIASDYAQLTLGKYLFALADEQSSKVRVQFLPQSASTLRDLERGEADLLIVPAGYTSEQHPCQPLFQDDFCCVVWRDGALAEGPLTLERYLESDHVVMRPAGASIPSLEAVLIGQMGVQRRVAVTTSSFGPIPTMVVGTNFIATVHRRLALQALRTLPLAIKPSPLELPKMQQTMQWHQYRAADPGLAWLRELMLKAVERMDADPQA